MSSKQTHQRLRNLTKSKKEGDSASTHTSECAICLMSIAVSFPCAGFQDPSLIYISQPCQSLFVAPCSHVWHYKCIRPILNGPTWPNFLCPNCRAVADLEADVEDPGEFEDWEEEESPQTNNDADGSSTDGAGGNNPHMLPDRHVTPRSSTAPLNGTSDLSDLQHAITSISIHEPANTNAPRLETPQTPFRPIEPMTASVTQPVSIDRGPGGYNGLSPLYLAAHDGQAPDRAHDGPMTPRNDAGPFVLDGSAGRAAGGSRLREEEGGEGAPSIPPVRFD